jgi:hypothetical protein
MRRRLLAAVSLTALLSAPTFAQDANVDDERNEPVDTATADNGSPANLIIGANGRVRLTDQTGPAVRVNSNNNLTTASGSRIEIVDQDANGDNLLLDGAIGVQVDPGVTSDITHAGALQLLDSYSAAAAADDIEVDTDGDGVADAADSEADGPFAEDLNKIGMLIGAVDGDYAAIPGQAPVTGTVDLESTSSIDVEGQDSYGLRVATDVTGDILADGRVSILGERSTAIAIEGDVGGDVQINRVNVAAPSGSGVSIDGDVGGGLRFNGLVSVTGYRTDARLLADLMAQFDDGDDNLDSNSAVMIAGDVVDGVFIARSGDLRLASGSGAAMDIGSGGETITIGAATVPDDFDQAADDADEDDQADSYDHAIVNRGVIAGGGIFDGKDNTAFLIAGRDDQGLLRAVILGGQGLRNEGAITSTTFDGEAVALRIGEGGEGQAISNTGRIEGRALLGVDDDEFGPNSYGDARAFGLVLDEGSAIQEILNEGGQIIASVQDGVDRDGGPGATAILIDSNTVDRVLNEGRIAALISAIAPEGEESNPDLVAVDARNHDGGLTITQRQATDENGDPTTNTVAIEGDVWFGTGDDTLELLAGSMTGDVVFGGGADRLIINGAELNGAIRDSDANLTIDVTNGRIILTGTDSVALTDATFNDGGVLEIQIDTADQPAAFVNASGAVTFAEGSDLSVSLGGLIENANTFTLITADTLTIADQALLTATEAPFLYNAEIRAADNDPNTLVLSLSRKTADELGMNANEAAAYDEAFAAMTAITSLGDAFASVRTADEFFGAYNQLLPEYAASAIQFALASNDAAAGALSTRLRNARLSPDELAGVWIQEFGYFADRSSTAFGPGYRGQGVGVAMGIDRPMGPFYAVGFHLVGSASEVEEIDGFDDPMVALSGQFGGYAAMDLGGIDVSGSVGIGYDHFETERNIIVDSFATTNTAQWSGWHISAAAQAGRDFGMGAWTVRPEASLTWLSLFESGYTEQNEDDALAALALIVDDRETSVLNASASVAIARRFGADISWWAPSIRVGYRGELIGDSTDTVARFGETGSPFTLQSESLPGSGILAGFGLSAGSQYTTFTFAYDADVRDQFVRHVARLVVRLTF